MQEPNSQSSRQQSRPNQAAGSLDQYRGREDARFNEKTPADAPRSHSSRRPVDRSEGTNPATAPGRFATATDVLGKSENARASEGHGRGWSHWFSGGGKSAGERDLEKGDPRSKNGDKQ